MMAAPLYSGAVIALALIVWDINKYCAVAVFTLGMIPAIPIALWWIHSSTVFKGQQPEVGLWVQSGATLDQESNFYLGRRDGRAFVEKYEQWRADGRPLLTRYAMRRLDTDLIKVKGSRNEVGGEQWHWLGSCTQIALRWHLDWLAGRIHEAD